MTTRAWDITKPADTDFIGEGDDALRNLKVDLKERIEIDHWFNNVTDPNQGNCDGYHKKVTLLAQGTAPANVVGAGLVYTKIVDGVVELFFKDDAGTENQLTENGVIKLNTLQNDINGNGKNITNLGVVNAGELQIGNGTISTWRDYLFLQYQNPNWVIDAANGPFFDIFYFNFTLRGLSYINFWTTGYPDEYVELYFHGNSNGVSGPILLPGNYTIKANLRKWNPFTPGGIVYAKLLMSFGNNHLANNQIVWTF